MNIAQFYLNLAFDKVTEVCMEATLDTMQFSE